MHRYGESFKWNGLELPFHCTAAFIFFQIPVWGSIFIAGALFGQIAQHLAGRGLSRFAAVSAGTILILASFAGSQLVDRIPNFETLPVPLQSFVPVGDIAAPFAVVVFMIALVFSLTVGLFMRSPLFFGHALIAVAITGFVYLGIASILFAPGPGSKLVDTIPAFGFSLGRMVKTIQISNLITGSVGGLTVLSLLAKGIQEE